MRFTAYAQYKNFFHELTWKTEDIDFRKRRDFEAEDLNKNVSDWEEKKRNSWVYRKSDL